jgi:hypothetical protein
MVNVLQQILSANLLTIQEPVHHVIQAINLVMIAVSKLKQGHQTVKPTMANLVNNVNMDTSSTQPLISVPV